MQTPLPMRHILACLSHLLFSALTVAVLAAPAAAQKKKFDPPDPHSFVTLQFDNDFFAGDDRHFTNGMRAAYLSPEGAVPALIRKAGEVIPLFHSSQNMRFGFSIGQNIYTPTDISISDPPSTDRPYAGWLYTGFGLVSEDGTWQDKLELDIGIVGPYSLAEETQTEWHRVFGFQQPKGWKHQLKNEPGVALYYEKSRRSLYEFPLHRLIPIENLGVDFTPHVGLALGNVMTYGAAGFTARFGDDLPADFGPPKIRPNLPGSDYFQPDDSIGWYLFGGMEGRIVARNIFLDGNTFQNSRSVDKNPVVADFQAGAAITFWRARISYTHIWRTPEYIGQAAFDNFGSGALSLRF
jgi:lipid A 3-O-deacylase